MPSRLPTEERQAEIIAAALRLAQDRSPGLITTADIAAAVGVSQGALFKHFPSKEAIWLAAMQWVQASLLGALEAAAQSDPSPLVTLKAVFMAHVHFVVAHPGVPRTIFQELQQPADSDIKQAVRSLLQAYRKLLLKRLQAAVAQAEVPADLDLEAAATLFVGIVQGLVMQAMLSGKPTTMKTQAERVYSLYLRGISQPAPPAQPA
jgi:TetR/AcrR family transcriptional regulator